MEQQLINALQQIRFCRNNMTKNDFFRIIDKTVTDNNVLIPLVELLALCTIQRVLENVENVESE